MSSFQQPLKLYYENLFLYSNNKSSNAIVWKVPSNKSCFCCNSGLGCMIINVTLTILRRQSETDLFIMSLLYFLQIEWGGHNVPCPQGHPIECLDEIKWNSQGFLRYRDIFRLEKRQNKELAKGADARCHVHNWLLHTFAASELNYYASIICPYSVNTCVVHIVPWSTLKFIFFFSFFVSFQVASLAICYSAWRFCLITHKLKSGSTTPPRGKQKQTPKAALTLVHNSTIPPRRATLAPYLARCLDGVDKNPLATRRPR